ncbi:MAG: oligopeptide/dipeptide ABC transporter ATP-binding protein [Pseudomonadota bacterium]
MSLLQVRNLKKHFPVQRGLPFIGTKATVKAVDGVSFDVAAGETFALVGESGCGKTTIAKLVLLLEEPTDGSIHFDGADITAMSSAEVKTYRRNAQAVFQDPYSSLNPRLKIGDILAEPIRAHKAMSPAETDKRLQEVLEIVGLPSNAPNLYAHEFSGGQRQRIAIARALTLNPRFIVLDEPISALDVSIRAQILNLLDDIQKEFGLTYLIIAHDLALVEHVSTTVGVMYLGNIVEIGPTEEVFNNPQHPYTQALLAAVPRPDPTRGLDEQLISGEISSAMAPPPGCKFHPRCPHAHAACSGTPPELRAVSDTREAACYLLEETGA